MPRFLLSPRGASSTTAGNWRRPVVRAIVNLASYDFVLRSLISGALHAGRAICAQNRIQNRITQNEWRPHSADFDDLTGDPHLNRPIIQKASERGLSHVYGFDHSRDRFGGSPGYDPLLPKDPHIGHRDFSRSTIKPGTDGKIHSKE